MQGSSACRLTYFSVNENGENLLTGINLLMLEGELKVYYDALLHSDISEPIF